MRYPSCGDYFEDSKGVHFRVAALGDAQLEGLVLLHEIVEYLWVKAHKVPISSIDRFDKKFERERARGKHGNDEPGDCESAPYYEGHQDATFVEEYMAAAIGVDWNEYEKVVNSL